MKLFSKYALYVALVQAWAAVLGSLYFSQIVGLKPCPLCWYQRILMFPLAVILPIAIWRNDKKVYWYVLPLSLVGALIGFYQYLLQMTPLSPITTCSVYESCEVINFALFGFITIPFLSMVAFIVISISMLFLVKSKSPK